MACSIGPRVGDTFCKRSITRRCRHIGNMSRPRRHSIWHSSRLAPVVRLVLGLVIALAVREVAAQGDDSRPSPAPSPALSRQKGPSDATVQRAVDTLLDFATVPSADNQYFPRFAREKIAWLTARVRARTATVLLLKDLAGTNLGADDLMASVVLDGRYTIVISQPRFTQLLVEGGRAEPPFVEQQQNDFMLGLVHEVVHLQGAPPGPARSQDRVREESRTWREVSINVVRPLRRLGQRVHPKFVRVDQALRWCDDLLPCPEFARAIFR